MALSVLDGSFCVWLGKMEIKMVEYWEVDERDLGVNLGEIWAQFRSFFIEIAPRSRRDQSGCNRRSFAITSPSSLCSGVSESANGSEKYCDGEEWRLQGGLGMIW